MAILEQVLEEIRGVLTAVDPRVVEEFAESLVQTKGRIFVFGEGRSGLMGKAFAMRLMHLGAPVYAVGETITPAMETGDTLVAISGSGTTSSVVDKAEKASAMACAVSAITTNPEAPLAKHAHRVVCIPAATKHRREGEAASIQPLGSLFDQSLHVLLDAVCLHYAQMRAVANETAKARHANLE